MWTKLQAEGNIPKLSEHRTAVYKDSIILFGGYQKVLNNTPQSPYFYEYNCYTSTWKPIENFKGKSPSGRTGHAICLLNDTLYVCGGYERTKLMDMHAFHFPSKTWFSQKLTQQPTARSYHTLVGYKDVLILFGGADSIHGERNDVWFFDVHLFKWVLIPTTGDVPLPRRAHTSTVYRDYMFVIGGDTKDSHSMYVLDIPSRVWRSLPAFPTGTTYYHTVALYRDYIYTFAGYSKTTNNALYRYDIRNSQWERIFHEGDVPEPRNFHSANIIGEKMYVFGGFTSLSNYSNDLYRLTLGNEVTFKYNSKIRQLYDVVFHHWV